MSSEVESAFAEAAAAEVRWVKTARGEWWLRLDPLCFRLISEEGQWRVEEFFYRPPTRSSSWALLWFSDGQWRGDRTRQWVTEPLRDWLALSRIAQARTRTRRELVEISRAAISRRAAGQ